MKKILIASFILALASCSNLHFTVLSTQNVDFKTDTVLKQKQVRVSSMTINGAVKKCIKKGDGTYLTNVVVARGVWVVVVADVYGKK